MRSIRIEPTNQLRMNCVLPTLLPVAAARRSTRSACSSE
jgi:hypothetical protein